MQETRERFFILANKYFDYMIYQGTENLTDIEAAELHELSDHLCFNLEIKYNIEEATV